MPSGAKEKPEAAFGEMSFRQLMLGIKNGTLTVVKISRLSADRQIKLDRTARAGGSRHRAKIRYRAVVRNRETYQRYTVYLTASQVKQLGGKYNSEIKQKATSGRLSFLTYKGSIQRKPPEIIRKDKGKGKDKE